MAPAASEKQRRFMAMVLAHKRGKIKKPSKKVMLASRSMSEKSARDFATKAGRRRGIARSLA